jgi:hypothetical protein
MDANDIGFGLNKLLAFDWGQYREKAEDKSDLWEHDAPRRLQAQHLLESSPYLQAVWREGTRTRFLESLTYFHWLLQLHRAGPDFFNTLEGEITSDGVVQPVACLDAGAKNWSYVAALPAFLESLGILAYRIDGVELDAGRRYLSGHTRGQVARTHAQSLPNTEYHAANVLDWTHSVQLVTLFLPFVFEDPHLAWGLPKRYFQPAVLLLHLLKLLTPQKGVLLVVNQGEAEAEAQEALFQQVARMLPIRWQAARQLDAPFIEYRYPRYGWLCQPS